MLDLAAVRKNPDAVAASLRRRGPVPALEGLLRLDARRRALLVEVEGTKKVRNEKSKAIGEVVKSGGDAAAAREEAQFLKGLLGAALAVVSAIAGFVILGGLAA